MRWTAKLLLVWMLLGTATALGDLRTWVASLDPQATAAQAREFGLFLPAKINISKPLVLLIHGLDMDRDDWQPTADQLSAAGYQVAWFCYPQDQPIADDVRSLKKQMVSLRKDLPGLKVDVIAFSMGSLVARGYVEGAGYAGGIDRLILLAPPNHGSTWAKYGVLLKLKQHVHLSMTDPSWRWSWVVTSGLCEADDDLAPGSEFLNHLNALPRRDGVRYTIIEGNQHVFRRLAADALAASAQYISEQAADRPCAQKLQATLEYESKIVRAKTDKSDGPVTLDSAWLPGVHDIVCITSDHQKMIDLTSDNPPLAWHIIRDRLDSDR